MNEEVQTTEQPQGGINSMMIIGAVVLLAIIGFFVIRQTSGGEQQAATDEAGGVTETRLSDDEGGDPSMDDEHMIGGDAMPPSDQAGETAAGETTTGQTVEGDTVVVTMEAGAFYYSPDVIRVKKGQKVRIEMNSVGNGMMMHDFNIDELGVSMDNVPDGQSGSVEFVADTVGEFEYYCSVSDHRNKGQVGTLIVEE